jgi:hypothetical protein
MRRSIRLLLVLLSTGLALPAAWAGSVTVCPPGDTILFYVLYGLPNGNLDVNNQYSGISPPPDPRPHQVELLGVDTGNLYSVCSSSQTTFERSRNIKMGNLLAGTELWDVRDGLTGSGIGRVWWDWEEPYAEGGSISVQRFYECKDATGSPTGIVSNVAAFGTGLDPYALNVPESAKFLYVKPLRTIVLSLADAHMRNPGGADCSDELSKDDFAALYWSQASLWYLNIDPVIGVGDAPDP